MKTALAPSTDLTASANTFFADAVTTVVNIKATGGQIYLLDLMNGAAATSYLQVFFQPAARIALGTTVADMVIKLPTNAGSGFVKTIPFPVPVGGRILAGFSLGAGVTGPGTGLSIAGTTSPTNATTAAIGVSAVFL